MNCPRYVAAYARNIFLGDIGLKKTDYLGALYYEKGRGLGFLSKKNHFDFFATILQNIYVV